MGNFFGNLGDRLQAFMIGRNGPDRLGRWVIGLGLIFAVVNIFVPNIVCSVLCYVCLFYAIYRMLSKNVADRRREDEKFEALLSRFSGRKRGPGEGGSSAGRGPGKCGSSAGRGPGEGKPGAKGGFGTRGASGASRSSGVKGRNSGDAYAKGADPAKTTFKCEQCGQSLSVPKGRGTLKVTCPKCHHQQKVKS